MNIVLIEDSEDDAFFFFHALKGTGLPAEVTHLPGGSEAITFLTELSEGKHATPDLIFLDLKLPVYSGFDILQWLKDRSMLGGLRIAILSGSDHPSDLQTAREFGIMDYLVKPLSPDDLRRRIQAAGKAAPPAAALSRTS